MPTFTLPPSPAYLIALSGGADSSLLLELTVRALAERDPSEGARVAAAHLHHGIRGEEADRDERFCQALCDRLGIRLFIERADVPALAEASGESLETVARRVRYDFFRRIMAEESIPTLLTAHHADDNLETILDRLLRGSGTRGLGGIPPVRRMGTTPDGTPLTVARPLLEWSKQDILDACEALASDYVTDSTNGETAYTRNRIRHTVVPALEAVAGRGIPQRAAARLSRAAREDDACLSEIAEAQVAAHTASDGGVALTALQCNHPAIAKRMIAHLYAVSHALTSHNTDETALYGRGSLTAAHLEALWALAERGVPESSLHLPCGLQARIRAGRFYVRPTVADPHPAAPVALPLGDTAWGERVTVRIEASEMPLPPLSGNGVWASACFPADLPLPLLARTRAAGDVILSHGMTKKLKKLLCDKHVPPHLRDTIPLICLPDATPLWYPAAAFRDGYPAPDNGACLRITVFLKENFKT